MHVFRMTDSVWDRVNLEMPRDIMVSVVVVAYFTGPSLWACLSTLQCDDQVDEVVLVINGEREFARDLIREYCDTHEKFRFVEGQGNVGFAQGANLGAQYAKGERLLFLNPDALLRRGSIAAMEMAAEGLHTPWIVGGRVFNADGSEQRGGRRRLPGVMSSLATFVNLGRFLPSIDEVNHNRRPLPDGPVKTEAVSGAMMYMSRESFNRLNGFDGGYFLHVEDIDICRRAVEQEGGDVVFTPLAGAMHYSGTSQRAKVKVEWEKAKGFGRYFWKFGGSPIAKGLAVMSVPLIASLLFARIFLRLITQKGARPA